MKRKFLFLALCVGAFGCQAPEEEAMDLDTMALSEEEMAEKHLAGEPGANPQETLIQESAAPEPSR